jgi:hypothetical protein
MLRDVPNLQRLSEDRLMSRLYSKKWMSWSQLLRKTHNLGLITANLIFHNP